MLIVDCMPHSISAEAYRMLRTNIKYSGVDKPIQVIQITSSVPQEGKTTIACNLAASLSQAGNKVLLIDCDLRRPYIHNILNINNFNGLTDYLVETCNLKDTIKIINKNMHVITSGVIPPNPAEIVGSRMLEELLLNLKKEYNYIVLDTPPVLPVTDSQLLAAKADATILVVRVNKVRENSIVQAYKQLKTVNANVIGSILNDSDINIYGKYYSYKEKRKNGLFHKMNRFKRRKK